MLEVKGRTILERQVEALRRCGVRDVVVVRGYRKEQVAVPGARFIDNDRFAETGELYSLFGAEPELDRPFVLLYGDIIFDPAILVRLLQTRADVAVVVDRAFHDAYHADLPLPAGPLDLVVTETPPNGRRFVAPEDGSRVVRIGPEVAPSEAHGEFIGMAMFSAAGAAALRAVHADLAAARAEGLERASVTHILQALIDRGQRIVAVDIHKGWMEIDTLEDYRRACAEVVR
jgi:phosphoenolpyruvate phosphomutase